MTTCIIICRVSKCTSNPYIVRHSPCNLLHTLRIYCKYHWVSILISTIDSSHRERSVMPFCYIRTDKHCVVWRDAFSTNITSTINTIHLDIVLSSEGFIPVEFEIKRLSVWLLTEISSKWWIWRCIYILCIYVHIISCMHWSSVRSSCMTTPLLYS